MATTEASAADLERRAILPGRFIDAPELGEGVRLRVVPIGWKHFRTSMAAITRVVAVLMRNAGAVASVTSKRTDGEVTSELLSILIPVAVEELFDLVAVCTSVVAASGAKDDGAKLDDLPHWRVAELMEVWSEESFGSGKWKPWAMAIERIVQGMTGKPFSIKATFSRFYSQPDTTGATSSSTGNPR